MGWRLFYARLNVDDQTAEFSFKDFAVRLQKVAPGVMFALFGAAVLGIALQQNLTLSNGASLSPNPNSQTQQTIEYLGAKNAEATGQLQALNFAVSLANLPTTSPISPDDRSRFNKKANNLTLLRNNIVRTMVTSAKFELWSRYNSTYLQNKDDVPSDARAAVAEVVDLMQDFGN
jgi:cytoskeletal protein RodZ